MKENLEFMKKHFVTDISAGLVVFLIALPLCLGISLASGAPLFSGIIAGIIGGIVVGFFSNSSINVSGPAASVALVIFTAIQSMGSFEAVLVAVILSGIFQIALGFLKAGTVAYFFPNAMIKGILASIGLILILKQIPHAFGVADVFQGVETFGSTDGSNTFSELAKIFYAISYGTTIITIVSLIIIIGWDRPALKKFKFFNYFPSALAAVIVSILINEFFKLYLPELALEASQLVKLPVADSFGEFFNFFQFPDFNALGNPEVITVALSITFIASLESLLSTEAGDKLDPYKRRTSTNRELKAQGIGNIVAGFVGGLPITAVIVRTSANVSSGGRTKTATITHGLIMLVCVASIPMILNLIPLAALSAVLFVVGYKLTSIPIYKAIFKQGKKQFLPFIITILVVMFTDLITGIMVGGTIAVFFILRDNYKNAYITQEKVKEEAGTKTLKLAQETTFLNKADIMLYLDHIPENSHLVIDGTEAKFVHHDIYEIIDEFKETAKYKNIKLEVVNLEQNLTEKFWRKQS
ncbi:SulP family inorganic anion transporter [Salegentibacter sp. JZCK2]|uniref:SulP family inorganic anion transporter n=1 Tax=Salegentibacter tibetensis TaxID=2873600 RepID=UPI001CCD8799|nr:SulP family inorganic anion transporter [Salegentibacter tibetensis]MBZ9728778.1 SulP family inorganic anion transporter [Salegentibacter tibetensis]